MTESDLREKLAARIAGKLLARQNQSGWTIREAEQLAFEIIATIEAAFIAASAGIDPQQSLDLSNRELRT